MCNGILFNHESEVRGPEFVTRKISLHVAGFHHGKRVPLELGNLDARKDWGYAKDYVEGMWKILNHSHPEDFVLGTGELRTVREFVVEAFATSPLKWLIHVVLVLGWIVLIARNEGHSFKYHLLQACVI